MNAPVHRPGATVGDEGEVARVVALRHRDLLDRAHHDLGLGGAVRVRTHELLVGERDHETLDETDVGARTAHVAGDEVGEVEPRMGSDHPSSPHGKSGGTPEQ